MINSSRFKKLLFSLLLLFFGSCMINTFAQSTTIDFKYKVDSVKSENGMQFHITVSILKGSAPFLIRLFEDFGNTHFEKIEAKENIQTNEVQFSVSKRGKYLIVIDDNNSNSLLKRFNLVNHQSL